MKLKIKSGGTTDTTFLLDEQENPVEGVTEIIWKASGESQLVTATVSIADIELDAVFEISTEPREVSEDPEVELAVAFEAAPKEA